MPVLLPLLQRVVKILHKELGLNHTRVRRYVHQPLALTNFYPRSRRSSDFCLLCLIGYPYVITCHLPPAASLFMLLFVCVNSYSSVVMFIFPHTQTNRSSTGRCSNRNIRKSPRLSLYNAARCLRTTSSHTRNRKVYFIHLSWSVIS